jgi:hypothetical protein
VTPHDELARLLHKYGHRAEAVTMQSLAAREEMRVEGEAFWKDLAGPAMFGAESSVASVLLGGVDAAASPELERDRGRFRRALFEVAQDLRLRGFDSADSEAWRVRLKTSR